MRPGRRQRSATPPLPCGLDVTDLGAIDATVKMVEERAGGIDILVNNAALFDLAPIVDITEASFDRLFAINVKGPLFVLQAVAKSMIARGQGGKIINMASQAGRRGETVGRRLLRDQGRGYQPHPVGWARPHQTRHQRPTRSPPASSTAPIGMASMRSSRDMKTWPSAKRKRRVGLAVPYGRMGTAEDLTGMAIFLASGESDYVVAQTFNVDGGSWMS